MGDLQGKVAFITGAGRGQGRAHAVRLAADGADIIAVDICADISTIPYAMSTSADLDETCRLVEKEGRQASAQIADVRDLSAMQGALAAGLSALEATHAGIVIANAGGCAYPSDVDEVTAFRDAVDVMCTGVWNTIKATSPAMIDAGQGGVIIVTSSTAAIKGFTGGWGGLDGYTAAKSGALGLSRLFANSLAPHNIRVNSIHPTGVVSGMTENEAFLEWATAAVENPIGNMMNKLPDVQMIEATDVANAVAWLVSDDARYVTGIALPVDAGFCNA